MTPTIVTPALVIALPLVYLALQWAALRRMERGWRAAALFPLLLMAGALLVMAVGLAAGMALAPAAVMIGLPVATLYLLVLWPLHIALGG